MRIRTPQNSGCSAVVRAAPRGGFSTPAQGATVIGLAGGSLLLLLTGTSYAQMAPSKSIPTSALVGSAAKPPVLLVGKSAVKPVDVDDIQFKQRTLPIAKKQSLEELLRDNGIQPTPKAVSGVKTLNPILGGKAIVPAGSRLTLLIPEVTSIKPGAELLQFDPAAVARYSVSKQVDDAKILATRTFELPEAAYASALDAKFHRAYAYEVKKTADLVNERAGTLSAADLALSRYYLDELNTQGQRLVALADSGKLIERDGLKALESSGAPLQRMQARLQQAKSPFDHRLIEVRLSSKTGAPPMDAMRVYVLPTGAVIRPETVSDELLRQLLTGLTLENLTTPARGVIPNASMHLWVGPKDAYDEMARLVREKKLRNTTLLQVTLDPGETKIVQLSFPEDVVQP